MKWVLLFLILSIAGFALVVFVVPVHVRIQLTLNRKQTLARVSLGIMNGLIWFTLYRTHDVTRLNQDSPEELISSTLQELIRNPENAWVLIAGTFRRILRNKPKQHLSEDKDEKPGIPQERFIQSISRQIFKRGLDILRFRVLLSFGTGDAATTGIAVGSIYTLVGAAMAVFSDKLRFPKDPPDITIRPCYNEVRVDLDFDSIVLLRPGDVVFRAIFGQD
mgnify:CR=1 FL=1